AIYRGLRQRRSQACRSVAGRAGGQRKQKIAFGERLPRSWWRSVVGGWRARCTCFLRRKLSAPHFPRTTIRLTLRAAHPHVHMIVTGGGISPDGSRWIASRPDYLVQVEVLSALFRGRMLGMLNDAHAAGRLQFFGNYQHLADPRAFKAHLDPCGRRTG